MTISPTIDPLALVEAQRIVGESGIASAVEQWLREDGHEAGNTGVDATTALTAWLTAALAGVRLTESNVAALINSTHDGCEVDEGDLRETTRQAASTIATRQSESMNTLLRAQLDGIGCAEDGISVALGTLPSGHQVATLVSNDILRQQSVPNIVVGVATDAGDLVQELLDRGRPLTRISGGSAYFPSATLQTPLRARGTEIVMEYSLDDEGRVLAAAAGRILVEGQWYRDDLPQPLLTASKDFHVAQKSNRKPDGRCVLDASVESKLEHRRDALLAARREYDSARPEGAPVSEFEQTCAYGTGEWRMAYAAHVNRESSFVVSFGETERSLVPKSSDLRGSAFMTALTVVGMNARRIADWKLYHSLDQGYGTLADEWYALYHLIEPRLKDAMHSWSAETQPGAVSDFVGGRWTVDTEETFDWVPDGAATVVEMTRATKELADDIAEKLIVALRAQASELLEEGGGVRDLSQHSCIVLRLDFVDADMYGSEEDDVWAAVPEEGVLVAAEATIHPTWAWRHP